MRRMAGNWQGSFVKLTFHEVIQMLGIIQIKIIIRDGIVESVLTDDTKIPIEVEVIEVDKDFEDYAELRDYAETLYGDARYAEVHTTFADFKQE